MYKTEKNAQGSVLPVYVIDRIAEGKEGRMEMDRMPGEFCGLHFEEPIRRWDEGIPLGNGLLGSLLWGEGSGFRMSIDRGDLWDETVCPETEKEDFRYRTIVELTRQGDTESIRRKFDAPYYRTTPTKIPAGKLIFDFGDCGNIVSDLCLERAEASVAFHGARGSIVLRSFLHAGKKLGFVAVDSEAFSFRVENPGFGMPVADRDEAESVEGDAVACLHYPPMETVTEGCIRGFVQEAADGLVYSLLAARKSDGQGTLIVYTVAASVDGEGWLEKAKRELLEALEHGYDAEFEEHRRWWESFWGKSGLRLPDRLFVKNWYLTNYLLGSCSRKGCKPMPLQGVWTADGGTLPPWKGDYHHNLNTQMSYYSYLKANHLEEGESFLDFLWDLKPEAERFARSFFETEGLCLPTVMTISGKPLGGSAIFALTPICQLWLCQFFERHYRYTGDEGFLRERAYPYLKETAEMILGLLKTDGQGIYQMPISGSPEIHEGSKGRYGVTSNFDRALLLYLFRTLKELSETMGNDDALRWAGVLERLPELSVNEEGELELFPGEGLPESHRHHSHAMAIHPLRLLDIDDPQDRRIVDGTVRWLEVMGSGYWTGYSYGWMAELYAVQRNGEGAACQLKLFWENFCSQNGFHLNGDYKRRGVSALHYRPFTLEGNMCAADALQEMLLKSEKGTIELFPAIPEDWKEASFEDFRGEMGALVSAALSGGRVNRFVLKAGKRTVYRIRAVRGVEDMHCAKLEPTFADGYLVVPVEEDGEYIFERKRRAAE